MGFSIKHKLLILTIGVMLLAFGAVAFVVDWMAASQQTADHATATQTLLQDVGAGIQAERERLQRGTQVLAGRGDVIAALNLLAGQTIPESVRQRVFEAEKKKLALELSKHAETLRILEIGVYDADGQLVAFTRKSPAARDGYAVGIGIWKECRLQLTGSNLAGLDWIRIDRPAGLPATADEFDSPAAPRVGMLRQDDRLRFAAIAPVRLLGGNPSGRIGWVRAVLDFSPVEVNALAQQRGMETLMLLSGRFDATNRLSLRPDDLAGAWPILDGAAPTVRKQPQPVHPQYFIDSATLALDNGETVWFVALRDLKAATQAQRPLSNRALAAAGAACCSSCCRRSGSVGAGSTRPARRPPMACQHPLPCRPKQRKNGNLRLKAPGMASGISIRPPAKSFSHPPGAACSVLPPRMCPTRSPPGVC